ncbi:LysR substrate-binding domain-containing protein [uncultured Cohaesibacter sp.]|uniref:LysR substrate-binding domain-containing protein n=1 Tax=uncultured Cohaesibacter sp. TaxID=1002546 RepID=UPI002930B517|nr:LysR substrate-binding domain-containing protein [uncultured Cohaesibacter sp.]
MTNLSMKQLRYFDALARHRHFGRAAEECAVTQPALSVQIKELEELIGTPLVERSARQIHLTGFGLSFAERTRDILRSVHDLEEFARSNNGQLGGQFRFGIIPTVAPYLLSSFITEMMACYPGLDLRPREAKTQILIQDLMESRLDAAIVALPISEPTIRELALFDEEFVLLRPASEVDKPIPSPDLLPEMRLLLLEEGHCFRDQALSYCSGKASSTRTLMEGSSLTTLVQMVAAGIGVTLIPEMAVDLETGSAKVSVSHMADPRPSRTIGMIWRKSNPLEEQLLEIAEIFRKIGTSGKTGMS